MLSKDERDAIRKRLDAVTASIIAADNEAGSLAHQWLSSLLAHADAADAEMARFAADLKDETALRERAEKGMDYFTSGDWVI